MHLAGPEQQHKAVRRDLTEPITDLILNIEGFVLKNIYSLFKKIIKKIEKYSKLFAKSIKLQIYIFMLKVSDI